MKEKKFLLRDRNTQLWLNGFDGENFEWTANRTEAWRLSEDQAQKRGLAVMLKMDADLTLDPAD